MTINFSCRLFSLKLLIFRLVIIYFRNAQIAPDHTIFIENFQGSMPKDPPSDSVCTQWYEPPTYLLFYYLLGNSPI